MLDQNGLIVTEQNGGPVSLKEYLLTIIANLRTEFLNLAEEAEKSRQQRYIAQQEAVGTAMTSQEKAVNAALAAAEKAVTAAMVASEKAITKAELAQKEKNESLNELRQMVNDWRGEFARTGEVTIQLKGLEDQIKVITAGNSRIGGRSEGFALSAGIAYSVVIALSVVISTAIAVFGFLLHR